MSMLDDVSGGSAAAAAARATDTRRQHNVFVRHLRASPSHLSDVATPSPNHDK